MESYPLQCLGASRFDVIGDDGGLCFRAEVDAQQEGVVSRIRLRRPRLDPTPQSGTSFLRDPVEMLVRPACLDDDLARGIALGNQPREDGVDPAAGR
jgi:hypothetical protein